MTEKKKINREIREYIHKENAKRKVKKESMYLPAQVEVPQEFLDVNGNLIIPSDVTDVPTDELGRYLTLFNRLAAYYDVVVTLADIDYSTAKRVLDFIEAKVLLDVNNQVDKRTTLTEKKAHRDCNVTVIDAQDWHDEMEANFKLASAILKGCERFIFMLSRELTRRLGRDSREVREYNVRRREEDNE